MESFSSYLQMGGYAGFIWSSYALAAILMVAVLVASVLKARSCERDLAQAQAQRPSRRRPRPAVMTQQESTPSDP